MFCFSRNISNKIRLYWTDCFASSSLHSTEESIHFISCSDLKSKTGWRVFFSRHPYVRMRFVQSTEKRFYTWNEIRFTYKRHNVNRKEIIHITVKKKNRLFFLLKKLSSTIIIIHILWMLLLLLWLSWWRGRGGWWWGIWRSHICCRSKKRTK